MPLISAHVRAKIVDMISQVTIFQEYQNNKPFAIECKYVIPMIDSACVSGFEAFINDKHIKGEMLHK